MDDGHFMATPLPSRAKVSLHKVRFWPFSGVLLFTLVTLSNLPLIKKYLPYNPQYSSMEMKCAHCFRNQKHINNKNKQIDEIINNKYFDGGCVISTILGNLAFKEARHLLEASYHKKVMLSHV